ncbi:hypothetical protein [Swingsia samuiensis]|uniref:UrcA family protein n=1 Tax=Swingsia samuiensis TaxID=1293412 RepID=A0A4Y6UHQ4_9PROT|nr:hypothetical protein [Swingsia samuiensis]QDH17103.1 hypothetical protein E3D00_05635 [Swingsia samuiensis]
MMKLFIRASLTLAFCAGFVTPLYANDGGAKTNDEDPMINAQGLVVNNVLKVLQIHPDAAGDSCVNALKEMHKAQDQLTKEEESDETQDLGVARDVVSSSMEDVTTICGADAHSLCRQSAASNPKLQAACKALPLND